jgi:ABC-2 type transport system ATP-binding protein
MTPIVSFERVCKAYGRHIVLRDVSFTIGTGEAVALIGPNGAGKTTMLRLLMGGLRASSGEVRLSGERVPEALSHTRTAYFGGEFTLPPAVTAASWRALFQERLACDGEARPLGVLSRGMRQMIALRTLFSLPALRVIALDEPWEALDPAAARWLGDAVRARRAGGAALFLSSHRLHDLAGLCDRYLFLTDGRVLSFDAAALCGGGRNGVTADTLLGMFERLCGGRA